MRKIIYPSGQKRIDMLKAYIYCFKDIIGRKQGAWTNLRNSDPKFLVFPDSWSEIITADFDSILKMYDDYSKIKLTADEEKEITRIFYYKTYIRKDGKNNITAANLIADFFMDSIHGIEIHTCFYCDMSYINVYRHRVAGVVTNKRHFDLDHVIPQKVCPMFGMSLYNFVPSCKECNQGIKHMEELGKGDIRKLRLFSPSSSGFKVDKKVKVRARMRKHCKSGFLANRDNYSIKLLSNRTYKEYVSFFHLEDRYDYHKDEALRLLDLKQRYSSKNIKQISQLLKVSPDKVREDIFGLEFAHDSHRCFEKLKRDIMEV